jgi:RimJ/RimL family protein N-acetyltransferase
MGFLARQACADPNQCEQLRQWTAIDRPKRQSGSAQSQPFCGTPGRVPNSGRAGMTRRLRACATAPGSVILIVHSRAMNVEVRRMTAGDLPGYHACLDIVAREDRYLLMRSAPPFERSRSWVMPHLQQNHPFFVAVIDARVVGWCDITPHEGEWFSHRGSLGMGVHPDFRRRGLGARLLRAAIAHAEAMGLERVELEVFASNHAARQLYERTGFTVEGTLRRARKVAGGYDDMVLMALFPNTVKT